jgi:hypothetical protein
MKLFPTFLLFTFFQFTSGTKQLRMLSVVSLPKMTVVSKFGTSP